MPNKPVYKRGFIKNAEALSEKYREELGLSKFAALDAFKLASHCNIPIFNIDELFAGQINNPAYSILSDTSKFSAFWMLNEDGEKIIIHNNKHSNERQQSNLMHELAHIILKHEIPEEIAKACYLFRLHYYNKEQEDEAKYLGSCLQITRPGLMWVTKEKFTVEQISEKYTASIEMVNFRLQKSGVLKQRAYMNRNT